ncbi:beta-N-acetylhexosaminidase [Paenibacillus sp. UNCCL117]|uniref:beta-N-acetylhexosaminidase n=1 Tax=unclassified Paenibacillus TaxID=185978 RepID=UPI00087E960C|nr:MULTISPECIES: beta-N-acetylhexosaminidase [unclassified Paenibacillus]SDD71128.1 beta-N-acetylhexosaminidase [Paenibacillus sp. cl123]SFW45474.1 beta-N-acetylhexosaminidase [Paenibacillus sp. UNCCL117]
MGNKQWELNELTLRQKIGQLLMCGFPGKTPTEEIGRLITDDAIGGVIYFRRNLEEPAQVAAMSEELQKKAEIAGLPPLLIAVDQEGGMVTRIEKGVTVMPGNMALGAVGDSDAAYIAGKVTGTELRQMGVNMNFAPSLDINNNPDNPVIGVRSYGGTAELVSELGVAAVRGLQDAGVAATVKHFPGHGDTGEDSHHSLPTVPHARERLDKLELAPFRRAIEQGTDAVMTAHVLFPSVEPERLPATLSSRVIEGLLRQELGYDGVVVTDCLEMNAIAGFYGIGEGAVKAVEAGADLVLVSHRYERQREALDALVAAVESGRISEERIDRSVQRLLALKNRRVSGEQPLAELEAAPALEPGGQLATQTSLKLAEHISERSITLLRGGELLPLDSGKPVLIIWPEVRVSSEVDEVLAREQSLGYWLSAKQWTVREERIGVKPTSEEAMRTLSLAAETEQVVFVSYNAAFIPEQAQLIQSLAGQPGIRLIVAAARVPFDIRVLPDVPTFLACYENTAPAMRALAMVLAGELEAAGRLPVPLAAE